MTDRKAVLEQVLSDLSAEGDELEATVAPLDEQEWRTQQDVVGFGDRVESSCRATGVYRGDEPMAGCGNRLGDRFVSSPTR